MTKKLWIALLHARQVQGDICHADVEAVFISEDEVQTFISQSSGQLTLDVDDIPCYAQRSIVSIEVENVQDKIWIVLMHARQIGGSFCHSQVEEVFADETTAKDFESFKPKESLVEIDGVSCFAMRRVIFYNLI